MATYLSHQEEQQIDSLYERVSAAPADLCSIWKVAKPYWDRLLEIVSKWPGGKKLAEILRKVGAALDYCCPTDGDDGSDLAEDERRALDEAYGAVVTDAAGEKPCCHIWKRVKPYWPTIIRIVERFSPKLAEILRKLGDALDKFCG